jgi:integrase
LIGEVPNIDMPKKPEGRKRFLSEDEVARLLAACRLSQNKTLVHAVQLALHTGMRRSELLGLEWERVDLSTSRITLVKTKSGKPRRIPINAAAYEALTSLRTLREGEGESTGRVFPRGSVRKAFATASRRA